MMTAAVLSTVSSNRTLRNTFLLLAITLIPTMLGVMLGESIGLNDFMKTINPIVGFIGTLVIMIGMMFLVFMFSSSAIGILFLLGFTSLMGMVLSGAIMNVLSLKDGQMILTQTILTTILVCVSCSIYAMTTKRDFSGIGSYLFFILLGVIAVSILNLWLQISMLGLAISVVCVVLFSVYLIHDVQKIVNGGETNYIIATMQVYLNIANIFINLLNIFSSDD